MPKQRSHEVAQVIADAHPSGGWYYREKARDGSHVYGEICRNEDHAREVARVRGHLARLQLLAPKSAPIVSKQKPIVLTPKTRSILTRLMRNPTAKIADAEQGNFSHLKRLRLFADGQVTDAGRALVGA